jgi:hypothetical protein
LLVLSGQQFWFEYTHENIEGEFDFIVEGGSTQPNNETFVASKRLR